MKFYREDDINQKELEKEIGGPNLYLPMVTICYMTPWFFFLLTLINTL